MLSVCLPFSPFKFHPTLPLKDASTAYLQLSTYSNNSMVYIYIYIYIHICVCVCVCVCMCVCICRRATLETLNVFYRCLQQPPVGQSLLVIEDSWSHSTFNGNPLDEWSARRTELYLTTNTHKRQISMLRRVSNPQSQEESGRRPTP